MAHIVNPTTEVVIANVLLLLSYGSKVAIRNNKPSKKQVFATIADVENILVDINDSEAQNRVRGKS